MKTKKKILVFVIVCGLCLHLGAFLWVQNHSLTGGFQKWNQADFFGGHILESIKHNRHLSEIFSPTVETLATSHEDPPPPVVATPDFVLSEDEELAFLRQENDLLFSEMREGETWTAGTPLFETPTKSMALMTLSPPQVEFPLGAQETPECKDVSVTVQYAPRRFRPGYVFKLTLCPKADAPFTPLPQHYVFVLDRSHTIPRLRYYHNRRAVSEALSQLGPEDTFNLFVFDHRVTRFSDVPLPCNKETLGAAREFLERQPHGGVLAASEICGSLGKVIAHDALSDRITTVILLSDGATYLSPEKQRDTMRQWMQKYQGKIVLFPVVSGGGIHQPLLDLLSAFNRGASIYAGHYQEVGERLRELITTIKHPIGKRVVATALSEDKQMTIQLQPTPSRLPLLYQNRPFVIWGTTNRLADFTLFLQGEDSGTPFDIKKTISFTDAHGGTLALERQWTELLAQEYYGMYFEDGKQGHLEAARKLLVPLNLPVPLP